MVKVKYGNRTCLCCRGLVPSQHNENGLSIDDNHEINPGPLMVKQELMEVTAERRRHTGQASPDQETEQLGPLRIV